MHCGYISKGQYQSLYGDFTVYVCDSAATRPFSQITLGRLNVSLLKPTYCHGCVLSTVFLKKLETVAINDVLPLKASCLDPIANIKCFRPRDIPT